MAQKRKIEWTTAARVSILEILEYYAMRNGNVAYSRKIYFQTKKAIKLISKQCFLGKPTDIEGIRVIIIKDYLIFYEVLKASILIHTIWDSRRNPEYFKIKGK